MTSIFMYSWVALAALLSAVFILLLLKPARRFNLIDHPAGRKIHHAPTPLVGGLAIFLSLLVTLGLAGVLSGQSGSLWLAMVATVAIGVADDAHEIGYRSKFFAQLLAALLIVSGTAIHVMHFGDIFGVGDFPLDKWSYLVTVIAIIGLMNAINMIDGVDGLAGTQVLIPLVVFALVALGVGDLASAWELMILAGAVAGFLVFNLRSPWLQRALVFMGDTGGLLLGLLLAWYAVKLAGVASAPLRPISAVWILMVPLLDMGSVMFLRMLQRKSPFSADRQHLHYVLIDAGYSVSQVVSLMAALSLLFSLLALFCQANGVPEALMFVAFVGLLAGYITLLANPQVVAKRANATRPIA